jgi:DNA repair exonuclease SbcCD nuclease subunit|tara:strand:+ start:956 stop:1807 length:852 start_codon:yes stop_codon:yes gene_type:complete
MTRFIYIADTHLGASGPGFQQQQRYPERVAEILPALRAVICEGEIDFVLHGGDMVDGPAESVVRAAAGHFDLPVPTYLCLGNHDLSWPDSLERWMRCAPDFFPDGRPEFSITTDDCIIHVVPNQWGSTPYHWVHLDREWFTDEQMSFLSNGLEIRPDLPHILSTHSPVFGVPVEQTGLPKPFHPPKDAFRDCVTGLATQHKHLRCVLGAHVHMNSRVSHAGVEYVHVSPVTETPFEYKIFEIESGTISMQTLTLADALPFKGDYDDSRTYVQGRPIDRAFESS